MTHGTVCPYHPRALPYSTIQICPECTPERPDAHTILQNPSRSVNVLHKPSATTSPLLDDPFIPLTTHTSVPYQNLDFKLPMHVLLREITTGATKHSRWSICTLMSPRANPTLTLLPPSAVTLMHAPHSCHNEPIRFSLALPTQSK